MKIKLTEAYKDKLDYHKRGKYTIIDGTGSDFDLWSENNAYVKVVCKWKTGQNQKVDYVLSCFRAPIDDNSPYDSWEMEKKMTATNFNDAIKKAEKWFKSVEADAQL